MPSAPAAALAASEAPVAYRATSHQIAPAASPSSATATTTAAITGPRSRRAEAPTDTGGGASASTEPAFSVASGRGAIASREVVHSSCPPQRAQLTC